MKLKSLHKDNVLDMTDMSFYLFTITTDLTLIL